MFGGTFNRVPFNRPYQNELSFTVDFEFKTETESKLNLEMSIPVIVEFKTEFATAMTREQTFEAMFELLAEFQTTMIRERIMDASFEFQLELQTQVKYTHTDEIIFTGGFAPGERIVIDSKKMKITKNGVNVLHLMDGDFFDLVFGVNKITYTDSEVTRSVLTRVTHKDVYLY